MLFEVAGERPGADLMEAPRAVPLPLALVGITVVALAEAMQVRAANEPPGHLKGRHHHLCAGAVRVRAGHRRRRAGAGRQPGRDPVRGPGSNRGKSNEPTADLVLFEFLGRLTISVTTVRTGSCASVEVVGVGDSVLL